MKFAFSGDLFAFFCLINLVKWMRIVSVIVEKITITYQKILEKCEMSFYSSENKNWIFFEYLIEYF
jgi:hypothetical protein